MRRSGKRLAAKNAGGEQGKGWHRHDKEKDGSADGFAVKGKKNGGNCRADRKTKNGKKREGEERDR